MLKMVRAPDRESNHHRGPKVMYVCNDVISTMYVCMSRRHKDTGHRDTKDTDTDPDSERHRKRDEATARDKDTDTETHRDRQTDRDSQSQRQTETERS